jgi:hypothetical protein
MVKYRHSVLGFPGLLRQSKACEQEHVIARGHPSERGKG